jgi:hypothetical protein
MPPQADVGSDEANREPKVRRISNKPPRKSADLESSPKEPAATAAAEADTAVKTEQKRSNRRRRGKGKSGQKASETSLPQESTVIEETVSLVQENPQHHASQKEQPEAREKTQESRPQSQKPRRKLDPEKVAKNAWKIFLAEVSEEGVALISDNDARELARRCFRLSEIFLEEEDKRG